MGQTLLVLSNCLIRIKWPFKKRHKSDKKECFKLYDIYIEED